MGIHQINLIFENKLVFIKYAQISNIETFKLILFERKSTLTTIKMVRGSKKVGIG